MNNETLFWNDYNINEISDWVKKNIAYNLLLSSFEISSAEINSKEEELADIYFGKINNLRKNKQLYCFLHQDEDLLEDNSYRIIFMKNRQSLGILGLLRCYVAFVLRKYNKKL